MKPSEMTTPELFAALRNEHPYSTAWADVLIELAARQHECPGFNEMKIDGFVGCHRLQQACKEAARGE